MKKNSRRRIRQSAINILAVGVLLVATYFLYQVSLEIIATVQLRRQLHQVEEELQQIENEYQYLSEQKDKLLDPEYVKNYARAGFMLSKEGEQIFFLPQNKEND